MEDPHVVLSVKRESELDELMVLISRSNSIVDGMVRSSKAIRKRTE